MIKKYRKGAIMKNILFKSLLIVIIAIIVTGVTCSCGADLDSAEELRKSGGLYIDEFHQISWEELTLQGLVTVSDRTIVSADPSVSGALYIPESINQINKGAFENCDKLISVVLPNTITRIEDFTFSDCKSLKTVTIPSSVEEICLTAFRDCWMLETICYEGDMYQWKSIENYAYQDLMTVEILTIDNNGDYK